MMSCEQCNRLPCQCSEQVESVSENYEETIKSLRFKLQAADHGLEQQQREIDNLKVLLSETDQILNHAWNQGYYSHVGSSKEEWSHEEKVNEWKAKRDADLANTTTV